MRAGAPAAAGVPPLPFAAAPVHKAEPPSNPRSNHSGQGKPPVPTAGRQGGTPKLPLESSRLQWQAAITVAGSTAQTSLQGLGKACLSCCQMFVQGVNAETPPWRT
jgi:hypothetical protein